MDLATSFFPRGNLQNVDSSFRKKHDFCALLRFYNPLNGYHPNMAIIPICFFRKDCHEAQKTPAPVGLEAPGPDVEVGAAERTAAAQRQEHQQNGEEDHGQSEEVRGPEKRNAAGAMVRNNMIVAVKTWEDDEVDDYFFVAVDVTSRSWWLSNFENYMID